MNPGLPLAKTFPQPMGVRDSNDVLMEFCFHVYKICCKAKNKYQEVPLPILHIVNAAPPSPRIPGRLGILGVECPACREFWGKEA